MGKPKPLEVLRAQEAEDHEALRAMGRKGSQVAFRNREGARLEAEHTSELAATDEAFRREQAGEDDLPPDNIN